MLPCGGIGLFEDCISKQVWDSKKSCYVDDGDQKISLRTTHPKELIKLGYVPFSLMQLGSCALKEAYTTPWLTKFTKESFLQWLQWDLSSKGIYSRGGGLVNVYYHEKDINKTFLSSEGEEKIKWLKEIGFEKVKDGFHNWVHNGKKVDLWFYQIPEDLQKYAFKEKAPLV